jgi:xylulose-5-phosphate/fructose-6-phosphate phosphoketolase
MVMPNDLDRFRLVMDVIEQLPGLRGRANHPARLRACVCGREHGEVAAEMAGWMWPRS